MLKTLVKEPILTRLLKHISLLFFLVSNEKIILVECDLIRCFRALVVWGFPNPLQFQANIFIPQWLPCMLDMPKQLNCLLLCCWCCHLFLLILQVSFSCSDLRQHCFLPCVFFQKIASSCYIIDLGIGLYMLILGLLTGMLLEFL